MGWVLSYIEYYITYIYLTKYSDERLEAEPHGFLCAGIIKMSMLLFRLVTVFSVVAAVVSERPRTCCKYSCDTPALSCPAWCSSQDDCVLR